MDGLDQARVEVEKHREGLRKVEEELGEALSAREELEPSGLFGLFAAAPDPEAVEAADMTVAILKEELRLRRQAFAQAHSSMEQLESDATRGAVLPPGIDDVEAAAIAVEGLKRLDRVLQQLQTIASKADTAREAVPLTRYRGRGGRRADPAAQAKRASAVLQHTENWEPLVDQAELLADLVGVPLVLPRRWEAEARPDRAPHPEADVALARQAALSADNQAFGLAISFVGGELDALQRKGWNTLGAIEEAFPEASRLAAGQPFDPMQANTTKAPPAAKAPLASLREVWEALRKAHDALAALSSRGARTVDYLDTMAVWQRHAQAVAASPIAQQHELVPPINEGGDLTAFVQRVLTEWPELDHRFRYQTGRR